MEAEKQWKISVNARAKRFHFKFKATKKEPSWNFLRFSIFLRLHQFLLELRSDSTTSIPGKQPRTLKSRALRFFKRFRTPTRKRRAIFIKEKLNPQYPESKSFDDQQESFAAEETVCGGSVLVGTLALLSKSISENDQRGIVVHGSSVLLFLALFCKKHIAGKSRKLLVFVTIATVVCGVVFLKYMNCNEASVSELVWKAWSYVVSSGCLYMLSQVMLSRFYHFDGIGFGANVNQSLNPNYSGLGVGLQ